MDDRDYEKLLAQVIRLERGWLDVYCDPAGNLIIAADPPGEQASTDRKRTTLLESRLRRVASDLEDILPDVGRLDAVRQRVLIHMAFTWESSNCGRGSFRLFSPVSGKPQRTR